MLRNIALGIDIGYKRYGFAIGHNSEVIIPLLIYNVKNGVLPIYVLDNLLKKYQCKTIVIGINDDYRSPKYIQNLGYSLGKLCKIRYGHVMQVKYVSERYTSYYAELMTKPGRYSDAQAAAHILANWYSHTDTKKTN